MPKPKIVSITYSEEMSEEAAMVFYRLIEKLVVESLPSDPHLIGLFLKESLEFNKQQ